MTVTSRNRLGFVSRIPGLVALFRPFPIHTHAHTQSAIALHVFAEGVWGSDLHDRVEAWLPHSDGMLPLYFSFSSLLFLAFFYGASFDAFLAGFIIMSGARTLTSLCFDPIRWGCSAYYSSEARLVFQFQGLSWFLARSVLQWHVQNWCCRFAVDFM